MLFPTLFLVPIGLFLTFKLCHGSIPCNLNDELVTIKCASKLIDENFLKSNSISFSLKQTGQLCQKYERFKECTNYVDPVCISNTLVNLQTFFNFICSDDFRITAVQEMSCLTTIDENSDHNYCLKNATAEFEIEFSNSTDIVWKHENATCSYVRRLLQCYTDFNLMKSCQRAIQSLLQAFRLVERERSRGGCDANGNCTCVDGYRFQNATRKCIDINECDEGTHLCSQICINFDGSYRCSCDDRFYRLSATNNRSCDRLDQVPIWLYFAHGQTIWNISEDGKNFQLARMGLQKTAMLDVDVKEQRLYYADIGGNVIERKNIDGTFPQSIQTYDVDGVEGIAVDWVSRNLYSVRKSNIFVQTLEGRYRKALYKNVTRMPRALVIYATAGLLYGSDWGSDAFIYKAASDGSQFDKIITENIVWPNALTIDIYAKRLYWADAFLDTIQSCDLNGNMRRTVITDPDAVPHVFGMAVADDFLYWTDWTYRGILRANKLDGHNITVLAQTALLPYSIKVYHPSLQPEIKNPCDAVGCTQLCLLSNNGVGGTCACAEGFVLEPDGKTCKSNCSDAEVACGGVDPKCLSKRYICDGIAHCEDKTDEENCAPRICVSGQFQCHDHKRCFDSASICDGIVNCFDESDEKYCDAEIQDDNVPSTSTIQSITHL